MSVRGISCTMPHKEPVCDLLDQIEEVAAEIKAVNTIVNDGRRLTGYNTDWLGILRPLEQRVALKDKKVSILGAGGAARAAAFGLKRAGAKIKIFNRDRARADELAKDLLCETGELSDVQGIVEREIIINATPVGMYPRDALALVPENDLSPRHIVFDTVYSPHETKLIQIAERQGATVIHGIEMLLHQGIAQFELYTGKPAPVEVMREVLFKHFRISKEK